jgi:4'-phosphopantetheinyl transferase
LPYWGEIVAGHNEDRMLDPGTVVVTSIPLDEPPVSVVLDDDERRRAGRFVFERDRRRFIAAHSAMRRVLGHYLDIPPEDVQFAAAARGKPHLANAPRDIRFNLSHSGERALLALTLGREVGIDIEQTRVVSDMFSLAERVFSPGERERLRSTPTDHQHDVFFRLWTRKESFIKALGEGMYFPLAEFDVSIDATGSQLLLSCAAAPQEMDRWTTRSLPCEPGYTAAITVEGKDFQVIPHAAPR